MTGITTDFPLKGVWQVVISPADHVPSHYTEKLGMSFAFDFAKSEDIEIPFFSRVMGVPIGKCKGWSEEVLSPCDGEVVAVHKIDKDRTSLNFFIDTLSSLRTFFFNSRRFDYNTVFGNYIIIRNESYCCLLAHLQENSIQVLVGDKVLSGDSIAKIGHCGSSQAPHLHFQIMDNENLSIAKGLAVNFDLLIEANDGEWKSVEKSVPARGARIKAL